MVYAIRSSEGYLWVGGVEPIGIDVDRAHVEV